MSTSESEPEGDVEHFNKRRKSDPSKWKRNKIPALKAKGLQHVNWKGNVVPQRSTGPDCLCKKKCWEKFTDAEKSRILKNFNGLGTKLAQDVHLQSGIKPTAVKRQRPNAAKHKTSSYYYFISKGKDQVSVCRKAFCSLYGIKDGRVKRLAKLKSEDGVVTENRGKHHNRPAAYSEDVLSLIHAHIKSFPLHQSHYSSNIKYYLSSEIGSVAKMHRLFLDKHYPYCFERLKNGTDQDKVCCVPLHVYRNYFNQHFNFKFGRPKTDVYNTCEELKNEIKSNKIKNNPSQVNALENRLRLHKTMANAFYTNMRKAQKAVEEDPEVECLVFDFMQHFPVPHLPVNEVFYLRQMWVYTFGIHHYFKGGDKAYFYMWSESDAKHGANEVISCLNHFIHNRVGDQCTKLTLFSDACTGQNRNNTMVRYLMTLVNTSRFKSITQFFPIRGHSFMPCDRDFAKLGKLKKQKERVGVPGEWIDLFQEKHDIIKFSQIQFFDYATHFSPYFKKTVTSQGESFGVTKYKRILYTKAKNTVAVSQTSNSNVWSTYHLLKTGFSFTGPVPEHPVMPTDTIYRGTFSVPIKSAKVADIKKLYRFLQPHEIAYYDSVKGTLDLPNPDTNGDSNEEED